MLHISLAAKLRHQSWYMDSGCSRHITGRRNMFQELELKLGGSVGFWGNKKGKIIGNETIDNGFIPSITNVLLVNSLMHNLFPISQLSDNGYNIIFNQKSYKVVSQKDYSILFQWQKEKQHLQNQTFRFRKKNVKWLTSVNEEQWIWHRWLSHVSMRRISKLN